MFKDLQTAMLDRAMKLMMDPRVAKLLSNPKVMQLLMQTMQFKHKMSARWTERTRAIAEQFNLATREEVEEMRQELEYLRSRVNE